VKLLLRCLTVEDALTEFEPSRNQTEKTYCSDVFFGFFGQMVRIWGGVGADKKMRLAGFLGCRRRRMTFGILTPALNK